jgi:hypothetical protein
MAPVLCIVTPGDTHHEDALQGRIGDRNVSALFLFSHHRNEFDVRLRLGVAKVLRRRAMAACEILRRDSSFDLITIHAIR